MLKRDVRSCHYDGSLDNNGFSDQTLSLTVFLMILGIYGFLATAKLYERNRYHVRGAGALYERLEQLFPEAHVSQILASVKKEHDKTYRMTRVRLNHIWSFLHLLIAVLGFVYTLNIIL